MSIENKPGQFSLSLESMIEAKIQQKMAEIRAAAYREAFSDLLKQQASQIAFGDFLLSLNQQKQEFIDYVHELTLSEIVSMMGGNGVGGAQPAPSKDLLESNRRLQQERDQAIAERDQAIAERDKSKQHLKEKESEEPSRSRRSSEEVNSPLTLYKPKILEFLQGKVPQSVADIAHGMSADPDDFKRALYELFEEKKVDREGERRGAKYFVP
jgi:hypothetical protein